MLLITGGTGSLGRAFLRYTDWQGRIRVLARDEQKLEKLRAAIIDAGQEQRVQLVMGDIRDSDKMRWATKDVQVVVHAAALKVIPNANFNADEFIKTNCVGTVNVVQRAIDNGARKILYVSTDKGCMPHTYYGYTKAISEGFCIQANKWSKTCDVSCVRYGNVEHSRGSFTNMLRDWPASEPIPITDPECTRFWITLEAAVTFIDMAIREMKGGEIFVPRLAAKRLGDMIPEGREIKLIGLRQDEKVHEMLIGPHEIWRTECYPEHFVIRPWPERGNCTEPFPYTSSGDPTWGMV